MSQNRLFYFLSGAFSPPFHRLALVLGIFFVWSFLMSPDSLILNGMFADADDVVHLMRTVDWLSGQNWFDPVFYRMAPPEGVAHHFSRLAELPLAALMLPLHVLGLEWQMAALITSAIYPLVLLVFFFVVVRWVAESFLPPDWTRVSAYVAFFALPVMLQFMPSRVDHHGLSALITLMALGCVVRMMFQPQKLFWAFGGGFFLALGQAIALETLPWLLILSGWVGLWTLKKGPVMRRSAMVHALSLYLFSALFLVFSVSPSAYGALTSLSYSSLYVLLAGGIAASLVGAGLATFARRAWLRWAIGCFFAFGFGAAFLASFPELLAGPYGGVDPQLAQLMIKNISEAKPMGMDVFILIPALAIESCFRFMQGKKEEEDGAWWLFIFLLVASLLLATLYQKRVVLYVSLFSIIPLSVILYRGLSWAGKVFKGRKRFAMELFFILLVGPIISVLAPAIIDGRSFNRGVLLFPVQVTANKACASQSMWQILNLPSYYGDRPRLIMNTLNEARGILFNTKHSVMSAPYHTNVRGNLEAIRFFQTEDTKKAKKILRDSGAELVLLCRDVADFYDKNNVLSVSQDGSVDESVGKSLIQKLAQGETPSWLKRIEMPFFGELMLFEVLPKKL